MNEMSSVYSNNEIEPFAEKSKTKFSNKHMILRIKAESY